MNADLDPTRISQAISFPTTTSQPNQLEYLRTFGIDLLRSFPLSQDTIEILLSTPNYVTLDHVDSQTPHVKSSLGCRAPESTQQYRTSIAPGQWNVQSLSYIHIQLQKSTGLTQWENQTIPLVKPKHDPNEIANKIEPKQSIHEVDPWSSIHDHVHSSKKTGKPQKKGKKGKKKWKAVKIEYSVGKVSTYLP